MSITPAEDRATRAARRLAVAHAALLALYVSWFFLNRQPDAAFAWASDAFYRCLALLPIVTGAIAAGAPSLEPGARRAWRVLTVAGVLGFIPGTARLVASVLGNGTALGGLDVLWVPYYVLIAVGVVLLPSAPKTPAGRRTFALDALIVGVAGTALTIATIVEPVLRAGGRRAGRILPDVIYPVGDLVLFVALCALFARRASASDRRAVAAMAVSVGATFVADFIWSWHQLHGVQTIGSLMDPLWATAEFSWTLAATLHLVDAGRKEPPSPRSEVSMRLAIVPQIALTVLLAALIITFALGRPSVWIVVAVALSMVLLQLRQLLALREVAALERERQGQEARFRALVQHAADLVIVVQPDGTLGWLSPSAGRVLGIHETASAPQLLPLVHPDDRGAVARLLRDRARHDGGATPATFRCRDRLGAWRRLECVLTNLLDEPAVAGLVLNCRDVSDREALERQLVHAQKTEAIGRLAGGIAHDFNNLLAVVTANAQLLLESPVAAEAREELAEIELAARRGADLTRRLLAFSRRRHPTRPTRVVLDAVLAEAEPLLRRLVAKDVHLVLRRHAGDVGVQSDAAQLEQVLINLAINARDAMPDGGTLTIESRRLSLDAMAARRIAGALPGDYAEIVVRDDGTGMDDATRARLFEPFFTTKPTGEGTGLGLYIVYGIVSQAGGHVVVDSAPGLGTTFRVLLPVHEVEAAATSELPATAPRGAERLLVVDDEEAIRSALQRYLQRQGYSVAAAADGAAAREMLEREGPFDLVITDVVMPGMDGRALLEWLRLARPGQLALCMSGYTEDAELRHLVPPDRFVEKPFSLDALAQRIRATIDDARADALVE